VAAVRGEEWGACTTEGIVERLLRALNKRRPEEYQFYVFSVDEDEDAVYVTLRGRAGFDSEDLSEIARALEPCGSRVTYFEADVDGGELVLSLNMERPRRGKG
jgi:beta-xylosidase